MRCPRLASRMYYFSVRCFDGRVYFIWAVCHSPPDLLDMMCLDLSRCNLASFSLDLGLDRADLAGPVARTAMPIVVVLCRFRHTRTDIRIVIALQTAISEPGDAWSAGVTNNVTLPTKAGPFDPGQVAYKVMSAQMMQPSTSILQCDNIDAFSTTVMQVGGLRTASWGWPLAWVGVAWHS